MNHKMEPSLKYTKPLTPKTFDVPRFKYITLLSSSGSCQCHSSRQGVENTCVNVLGFGEATSLMSTDGWFQSVVGLCSKGTRAYNDVLWRGRLPQGRKERQRVSQPREFYFYKEEGNPLPHDGKIPMEKQRQHRVLIGVV